jgi:hypothetical protein
MQIAILPRSATATQVLLRGAVLRIRDVLSRIPIRPFSHPGFQIQTFFHPEAGFLVWLRYVPVLNYVPYWRKGMTLEKK